MFDFPTYMIKDWVMADENDKRIHNKYFQHLIAGIMNQVLSIWGSKLRFEFLHHSEKFWKAPDVYENGFDIGSLDSIYGHVDILVIKEAKYETRQEIINDFLTDKLCQK